MYFRLEPNLGVLFLWLWRVRAPSTLLSMRMQATAASIQTATISLSAASIYGSHLGSKQRQHLKLEREHNFNPSISELHIRLGCGRTAMEYHEK